MKARGPSRASSVRNTGAAKPDSRFMPSLSGRPIQARADARIACTAIGPLAAIRRAKSSAAGSTSWERCCLGLPTLQVVLANNQRSIASALQQAGAAKCTELHTMNHRDCESLLEPLVTPQALKDMSASASLIVDGWGTSRVASALIKKQSS